jgi:curved DNA-binding protein CbpA
MSDPYQTLGLPGDADEAAVRARYLELVRQFPPEQASQRFAEIRAAYDALKDRDARLRRRLFLAGPADGLDRLADRLAKTGDRPRLGLQALCDAHRIRG